MNRPRLNRIHINDALTLRRGRVMITMGVGQWSDFLRSSYQIGFTLVELDDQEQPVAAYRNPEPTELDDEDDEDDDLLDPTRRLTRFLN